MRGAEPLLVNISVAALARVGLHEKLAGNFLVSVNLGRAGKEIALRTVALIVHGFWRIGGDLNAGVTLPAGAARVPSSGAQSRNREETHGIKRDRPCAGSCHPP